MSHFAGSILNRNRASSLIASALLAICILCLGLTVITGWYLQNITLLQIHESFPPMQYNTALGFVLSGTGLLLSLYGYARMAMLVGAIVSLIGGLTLIEIYFQLDLGIDRLLMEPYVTTATASPGRMAPNSALCFLLSGIVLVLVNANARFNEMTLLGTVIIALGTIALLGYAMGLEAAYGWGYLTKMAIHTSVGFILLGLGLLSWGYNISRLSVQHLHMRNLLTAGLTLLGFTLLLWQALNTQKDNQIASKLQQQLENHQAALSLALDKHLQSLERMAVRWESNGGTSQPVWEADAQTYIRDFPIFQAIEWVDESFNANWIVSRSSDEEVKRLFIEHGSERHGLLTQALARDSTTIISPVKLVQGEYGLVVVRPLGVGGEFNGFILAIISVQKLLDSVVPTLSIADDFQFQFKLFDGDTLIASNPSNLAEHTVQLKKSSEFSFKESLWRTELALFNGPNTQSGSLWAHSNIVLSISAVISVLMLLLMHLRYREQTSIKQLAQQIELAEKEERLRVTLENMYDAVMLMDSQGGVLSFNKAAEQIFGYSTDDIIGKNIRTLVAEIDHGEPRQSLVDSFLSQEVGTIGQSFETLGRRANGEQFFMTIAVVDITLNNQLFFSATVRDISLRKATESKMKQYMLHLERSNKELDDFAYVASHDLKAPLRGIMQLASWIREDVQDSANTQTLDYLALMQNRITRLENLLNDLLAYSRIGRKHGEFKSINVSEMVAETFKLLSPPVNFTLNCSVDLPDFNTLSTPFELVMRNLINNAIKHHDSDCGAITVTAKNMREHIEFTVKDDGPGIAPEHQQRIFGLFQTLKPRDEVEGSGMGLAIIKKIIERYHCTINVESDGVRGTQFQFTWPKYNLLRSYLDE
jgi:PAS domain S-box-containing protein